MVSPPVLQAWGYTPIHRFFRWIFSLSVQDGGYRMPPNPRSTPSPILLPFSSRRRIQDASESKVNSIADPGRRQETWPERVLFFFRPADQCWRWRDRTVSISVWEKRTHAFVLIFIPTNFNSKDSSRLFAGTSQSNSSTPPQLSGSRVNFRIGGYTFQVRMKYRPVSQTPQDVKTPKNANASFIENVPE